MLRKLIAEWLGSFSLLATVIGWFLREETVEAA